MLGAQLWLNLPRKDKMTAPMYGDIKRADIPEIKEGDATIKVVAGKYRDTAGGFSGKYIPADYLDVEIAKGGSWSYESRAADRLFAYIVSGSAGFSPKGEEGAETAAKQAVLFTDGEVLNVRAGANGARMLLLCAAPLGEPVAWGGPIVMNTNEELNKAFDELDSGTFLRIGKEGEQA